MNNILVWSSFPRKGFTHDVKTVGGAAYTKDLLANLTESAEDLKFTVLAEQLSGIQEYTENGIRIKRSWKRNSPSSIIGTGVSLRHNPAETIIISYEMNMAGGLLAQCSFLLLLPVWKIFRKRTVLIMHHVAAFKFKPPALQLLAGIFYRYCLLFSDRMVVFEELFKKSLPESNKIVVIPLAFQPMKRMTKKKARSLLGLKMKDFYLLSFGYISPYKGIDKLVRIYNPRHDYKLILAGGPNPNHARNQQYMRYVEMVAAEAQKKNIPLTGVLIQPEIPLYYAAADAVIFPYTMQFSSSGPLSLAFSYRKPFLLSQQLGGYFNSSDFTGALRYSGLKEKQLLFSLEDSNVHRKISYLKKNSKKFERFSRYMNMQRNWKIIIKKYKEILLEKNV